MPEPLLPKNSPVCPKTLPLSRLIRQSPVILLCRRAACPLPPIRPLHNKPPHRADLLCSLRAFCADSEKAAPGLGCPAGLVQTFLVTTLIHPTLTKVRNAAPYLPR